MQYLIHTFQFQLNRYMLLEHINIEQSGASNKGGVS